MNFNIKEWGLPKKIISGIILILLLWFLGATFLGVNQATQKILNLPEGSVTIENADGSTREIKVKISDAGTSFSGVEPKVIEENVIYFSSNFPASSTRTFKKVSVPIVIARFDGEGVIKEIHEVPANTTTTINPTTKYQHTLIAAKGFFEENNISVENESTIK